MSLLIIFAAAQNGSTISWLVYYVPFDMCSLVTCVRRIHFDWGLKFAW